MARNFQSYLREAVEIVHNGEVSGWGYDTMVALHKQIPDWSSKDQIIYKDFCRWAFTPTPKMLSLIHI
eukprot:9975678-Karenia_brevis.AAC.1